MPLKIANKNIPELYIIQEMQKMRPKHIELYPNMDKPQREKLLFDWALDNLQEREVLISYAQDNIILTETDLNDIDKKDESAVLKKKLDKFLDSFRKKVGEISEKELKKYYKSHINHFRYPEQIHVKHIVKDPKTDANALNVMKIIKSKLDNSENFESVGNQYSDCGGLDLGYFSRGQMVQAFENVVFKMEVGEVSDIFQSEFGYHIAKVIDKRPAITAKFEQVKEQIHHTLITEKSEKEVQNFTDRLKKNFSFRYIDPDDLTKSAKRGFLFPKPQFFVSETSGTGL